MLSLVAFLIGVAIGGVVGALIAIPLFGALRVVAVRVLLPAQRQLAGVSPNEAAAVQRAEIVREEEPEEREERRTDVQPGVESMPRGGIKPVG